MNLTWEGKEILASFQGSSKVTTRDLISSMVSKLSTTSISKVTSYLLLIIRIKTGKSQKSGQVFFQ